MLETNPDTLIYFENDIVPLSQARVPVLTHAFHYGTGVFEGIRGYWSAERDDMFLVRCEEHYRRWIANCRILGIDPGKSSRELVELTSELIRLNHFQTDVYVRPLCYMSTPKIGVKPDGKSSFLIAAIPFGVYLPSDHGIHACVSSWRRLEDNAIPSRAKICGAYVNSVLATTEAQANGFDEAIFLNESGHVAEGSACNIFLVRNGALVTPAASENVLEGITRSSVIELAHQELHMDVIERPVDRTELYIADEVFFTGTAVEIAPVTRVDHRLVGDGKVGPIATRMREVYAAAVHGRHDRYAKWLKPVYQHVLDQLRH